MTTDVDTAVVTIHVMDFEPDVLKRIALLNGAFYRVIMGGARLIEVRRVDYETGYLEALVDTPPSRPRISGRVSVHYEPVDLFSALT